MTLFVFALVALLLLVIGVGGYLLLRSQVRATPGTRGEALEEERRWPVVRLKEPDIKGRNESERT